MIEMFDPPILLDRERLPEFPTTITTPAKPAPFSKCCRRAAFSGVAWLLVWKHRPT